MLQSLRCTQASRSLFRVTRQHLKSATSLRYYSLTPAESLEFDRASIDFTAVHKERTPITTGLWRLRQNLIKQMFNVDLDNPPQRGPLVARPPWQSHICLRLSFGTNESLRNTYMRFDGGIRFEKILEDMDALAGNVCQLHACNDGYSYPLNFVTASVDRIDMLRRFPMTQDLIMEGKATYVGRSSINVRMSISEKNDLNRLICSANFIMVAQDIFNDFKSTAINPLLLETGDDTRAFIRSEFEGELRRKEKNNRLWVKQPTLEESAIIHQFWLDQRNKVIDTCDNSQFLAMAQSRVERTTICQPQELNQQGKIFGGFLMREAYELARAAAFRFTGFDHTPIFAASDDISFEMPVRVGSIIRNEAFVACTDSPSRKEHSMQVVIRTYIQEPTPENDTDACGVVREQLSNLFSFTFVVPGKKLRRVVPDTYEESIIYLYARRGLLQSREVSIREGSVFAKFL